VPRAEPPPVSGRDWFNAGTRRLAEGKLNDAETSFQAALAEQEASVQPVALYNLGHVRFAQGVEELKKSSATGATAPRTKAVTSQAENAIRQATEALASRDMQQMVAAYERGRGSRKELRDVIKAIRRALELHGGTLRRWERSLGDFKGAVELNPADTNALHNVEVVERAIAKLVDSIRELRQMMAGLGQPKRELDERMKQLKGQIPEPLMPPGAAGEEEEEGEKGRSDEPKEGQQEGPQREGQERGLSPEEALWLLEGFRLDGERRLPMGQGAAGEPKTRGGKTW
jgi:tetratricopeptide (TPR) repeat protein